MDLDTREWFDGVLTDAARKVVKEPPEVSKISARLPRQTVSEANRKHIPMQAVVLLPFPTLLTKLWVRPTRCHARHRP